MTSTQRHLMLCATFLLLATPSNATVAGESLVSVFDGTGFIGRIRITNSQRGSYEYEGASYPCGVIYSAIVIDRYLGQAGRFEFYSQKELPQAKRSEYLAFLGAASHSSKTTSPHDRYDAMIDQCLSGVSLYAPFTLQAVLPIEDNCDKSTSRDSVSSDSDSILETLGLPPNSTYCLDQVEKSVRSILHELEDDSLQ